jgi:prepilin-type N-terminal cleavage/methylation domain-containing protein
MKQPHLLRRHAKQTGFTLVEVVIVLIVLGILAGLILNSLQTVQAKSRDANRRVEIDSIAHQLEECYSSPCKSTYPSLAQLTDTSSGGFIDTNFKNFDSNALLDTSNGAIQGNPPSAASQYQYEVSPNGCTGTTGDVPCKGYTLRSFQETNSEHPYVKESFNK